MRTSADIAADMHGLSVELWNALWSETGEDMCFSARSDIEAMQRLLKDIAWPAVNVPSAPVPAVDRVSSREASASGSFAPNPYALPDRCYRDVPECGVNGWYCSRSCELAAQYGEPYPAIFTER